MASTNRSALQETILNQARVQKIPVTVFMTNGYQQKGTVLSFDEFTVLVHNEGKQMLIYKHAISTIVPHECLEYNQE